MDKGWIKLHRKILENPIVCKDSDHFAVWVYLLLEATHDDIDVLFGGKRITLKSGQLITGRKSISEKFQISESKVQRILKMLESEQQIEQQTTSVNRLISIVKLSEYQSSEQPFEQRVNNERTTSEQRVNTNKNIRMKEYIDNTIILDSNKTIDSTSYSTCGDLKKITTEQKEKLFYDSLTPYVGVYPREMIRSFYNYWSEWNKSGKKMRWELEKTWQIEKRLEYWNRRSNSRIENGNRTNTSIDKEKRDAEFADYISKKLANVGSGD